MSGATIRVLNSDGRCIATYDNAAVDNDLDPPYAILRNSETNTVIALVPTMYLLDISPLANIPDGLGLIDDSPPLFPHCALTAACSKLAGHADPCNQNIYVPSPD